MGGAGRARSVESGVAVVVVVDRRVSRRTRAEADIRESQSAVVVVDDGVASRARIEEVGFSEVVDDDATAVDDNAGTGELEHVRDVERVAWCAGIEGEASDRSDGDRERQRRRVRRTKRSSTAGYRGRVPVGRRIEVG